MPKLCQILAIEKQTKDNTNSRVTEVYHLLQKAPLLAGIRRTYTPKADDGEKFPSESNHVQVRVTEALAAVAHEMTALFDIVAIRDNSNTFANADVEVDGVAILKKVPAVTLLFLEKQLNDMHTVICKLPELPVTETWHFDTNANCFSTDPVETSKSKKITKPLVKYEATKEHPAQVEMVSEDILVGNWTTVSFSGALPRDRKQVLRDRCEKLLAAVKFAREKANQADAPNVSVGKEIFDFLLA